MTSATSPTGTLMKNTDSQPMCCTSRPPTIGPAAVEAAMQALQMPMAMLRRSAGNAARNRPSAVGCNIAPNSPCTTRSPMISPISLDRPMPAEVRAKPTTPTRNTGLWPIRSPTLPAVISDTARGKAATFDPDPANNADTQSFTVLGPRADLEVVLEAAVPGETGVSPAERKMLMNILALRERRIEDVMVPRADIVAVHQDISLGELIKTFQVAAHSRLVVFNDTLDELDYLRNGGILQYVLRDLAA